MPEYLFLQQDFNELELRITKLEQRIKSIGQEMGDSTTQSSETYHDNYTFEQAQRDHALWSKQVAELRTIRAYARVVAPPKSIAKVAIGSQVILEFVETKDKVETEIGSYLTFDRPNTISYATPFGQIILNARKNTTRRGKIAGEKRSMKILEIK